MHESPSPEFTRIAHGSDQYIKAVVLRRRFLRTPLGLDFSEQELAAEVDEWHFGLCCGDEILASVTIVPNTQDTTAKLRQMVVDQTHQGRGLGRELLAHVEKDLAKRHITQIALNARMHAVPFYERQGYQVVSEPFIEVTIEHVKMTKNI